MILKYHLILTALSLLVATYDRSSVQAQGNITGNFSDPVPGDFAETVEVDVVFIVDESLGMTSDHDVLFSERGSIFGSMKQNTAGNFRVGLVGFGASPDVGGVFNGEPRKVGSLTDDVEEFGQAIMLLDAATTESAATPGFKAIILTANDELPQTATFDGTKMDGTRTGTSFPRRNGFCTSMITENESAGSGQGFNTVRSVTTALATAGNSTYHGAVPLDQVNPIGETYGAVAADTGGTATFIGGFRIFPQTYLQNTLDLCVDAIYSNAGCNPNGPYIETLVELPIDVTLTGSPTCPSEDEEFVEAFWSSPEINITTSSNPGVVNVTDFGQFNVCMTSVCLNPGNVTARRKCCTTLSILSRGGPTMSPTSLTPTPIGQTPVPTPSISTDVPTTTEPSLAPISPPTAQPSIAPSPSPTRQPSPSPTSIPSSAPTSSPSAQPTTAAPTSVPSVVPSFPPTRKPTPRPRPTPYPSTIPTGAPTPKPTPRPRPTPYPSTIPTGDPTPKPTPRPRPTPFPSSTTTSAPTPAPPVTRTPMPTNEPTQVLKQTHMPTPAQTRRMMMTPAPRQTHKPNPAPTTRMMRRMPRPTLVPTLAPTRNVGSFVMRANPGRMMMMMNLYHGKPPMGRNMNTTNDGHPIHQPASDHAPHHDHPPVHLHRPARHAPVSHGQNHYYSSDSSHSFKR